MVICFFFFQAEDGIRDYKVTGVQTCALPISQNKIITLEEIKDKLGKKVLRLKMEINMLNHTKEIGRASCRERV